MQVVSSGSSDAISKAKPILSGRICKLIFIITPSVYVVELFLDEGFEHFRIDIMVILGLMNMLLILTFLFKNEKLTYIRSNFV